MPSQAFVNTKELQKQTKKICCRHQTLQETIAYTNNQPAISYPANQMKIKWNFRKQKGKFIKEFHKKKKGKKIKTNFIITMIF